jgi:hypothetical protein
LLYNVGRALEGLRDKLDAMVPLVRKRLMTTPGVGETAS